MNERHAALLAARAAYMRFEHGGFGGGRVGGFGWWRWLGGGQESAAGLNVGTADAVGEDSIVANALESAGYLVQEKASQELRGVKFHGLGAATVSIVFPGECHIVFREVADSPVGERYAVGVASEVLENCLRVGEGWLGIDDPFFSANAASQSPEGGVFTKGKEIAMEFEVASSMESFESGHEFSAEDFPQNSDREEEVLSAWNPLAAIGR